MGCLATFVKLANSMEIRKYFTSKNTAIKSKCIILRVFYTLFEYSTNIHQVHYRTINARDELFYLFYNISKRYYIVNNFTQKIDVEILLTCTQ
jgi:hypothetical protein